MIILALLIVASAASAQWQDAYAQKFGDIPVDTTGVAHVVMLRQDGTPYAEMLSRTVVVDGMVYVFVINNDSSLVGNVKAEDDAIVKYRQRQMQQTRDLSSLPKWQREAIQELLSDSSRHDNSRCKK